MNQKELNHAIEGVVGAASGNIETTAYLLSPFSLYHGLALSVAYESRMIDYIVKRSGGGSTILWNRIPKDYYLSLLRRVLNQIRASTGLSEEELIVHGLSIRAGGAYLDYLRGDVIPRPGRQRCNFSLGCPLNLPIYDETEVPMQQDHVMSAVFGGTETQSMCSYHNRTKQDFPLFDLSTIRSFLGLETVALEETR